MPTFINRQTTLDLNGPILSFTTQPISKYICTSGIATFVGIATATFPQITSTIPTGYISYKWHLDGYGELSDGATNGMVVVGSSTTTLTLSNISDPNLFNNSKFFLRADYIPSAYVVPGFDVTADTARFTGNAINDPKDSDIAVLGIYPDILITKQPITSTVAQGSTATFVIESKLTDLSGDVNYQWQLDGIDLSDGSSNDGLSNISGSKTSSLTISSFVIGEFNIRCKITHSTSCNSPLYSEIVIFKVIPPRYLIGIEAYQNNSTLATIDEVNLENGSYSIDCSVIDSDTICLYSKERDIDVEVEMFASKGSDYPSNNKKGGEGGYSKIRYTMKKNDEYILRGIKSKNALFLYRKAQLISCIGSGGNSGSDGNGGKGGGVAISGENGLGPSGGTGGKVILSGQMQGNGIFGSSSLSNVVYSGDSISTGVNGGQTITCTKGVYWRQQGKTACEDLGTIKFILSDGREVTNSASISRGFKDGYAINQTAGRDDFIDGGKISGSGGNGATGGNGGSNGSGGGGGSGYTDTSIVITNSTLGGSQLENNKFVIKIASPLYDTGSVYHSFNNTTDQTLSLNYSGSVIGVSVESPNAPDFLVSTDMSAKHYKLTLNASYSSISFKPGSYTAGGGYQPGIRVARVMRESLFVYRVWFNRSDGYNTYISNFDVTCVI